MSTVTSPLQELADAGRASVNFMIHAEFDLPGGKGLTVNAYTYRGMPRATAQVQVFETKGNRRFWRPGAAAKDLGDALRGLAADYPKAVFRPESLRLSVRQGPAAAARFRPVVVRAWYEALGLPVPSDEELSKLRKTARGAGRAADGAVDELRGGPAGVAKFHRRPVRDRAAADLRKANLSGCDLSGVKFCGARMEGSDFSGSNLAGAEFFGRVGLGWQRSSLKKARFAGADLTGANLCATRCDGADFTGAKLVSASLQDVRAVGACFARADLTKAQGLSGYFTGADLTGADLTDADFRLTDVRGADFTAATLAGTTFVHGTFDEKTRWPRGYKIPEDLRWKGAGPDPRLAPTKSGKKLPKPTGFPGFLARLRGVADAAKLDKAMAMLKAERFQLFARVEADHLVGVVKSQSSRDLVYSCRLGADGKYACCTQNLNVCGGLRGSPCKHLLVLVVGLTQAGALDPATAHEWSQAARGRKAELDKDAMAVTFLRYKGAEAGEVDWRPTETIPEDFYAV